MTGPGVAAAVLCAAIAAALLVRPVPTVRAVRAVRSPDRSARERRGPPDSWLPLLAGAGAGAAALLFMGGAVGLLAGPVVGLAVGHAVRRMEPSRVRRRREQLEDGLPHAVDLLSACLSAGQEPGRALGQVAAVLDGAVAEELTAIAFRIGLGADPTSVWRSVSMHPQLGPLGRCVARALDSGASVSEAMHRLADDLRRESRARVESRARAVGVKAAVPLGVCMLPAFVLVGVVPLVASSMATLLR